MEQAQREHIHTVAGRYKGRIKGWDVVNEALEEDGVGPGLDGEGEHLGDLVGVEREDPVAQLGRRLDRDDVAVLVAQAARQA